MVAATSVALQQAVFWCLGEYAPTLCGANQRAFALEAGVGAGGAEPEHDLLLRLQHGATFSVWQVRTSCVSALAKLAIHSLNGEVSEICRPCG